MLEILILSLALQVALFIVVRLATGHGRLLVDVLAPVNIETTREALKWSFIGFALLWFFACIAHVTLSTMYTSFYLEFGPWHTRWQALLMLQSTVMFLTVLCGLAWCAATLCAMFQAAIVHARLNRGI